MKPWNIKQIAKELEDTFAMCHTDLERSVWHDCTILSKARAR